MATNYRIDTCHLDNVATYVTYEKGYNMIKLFTMTICYIAKGVGSQLSRSIGEPEILEDGLVSIQQSFTPTSNVQLAVVTCYSGSIEVICLITK